jgi:predicted transcriptional regulator
MDLIVANLTRLGLKEYEAKIYAALVGVGEANARTVHEVSGVPRPRVYDILQELTLKGFVEVRQGSPLMYRAVQPDIVISYLSSNLNQAASQSLEALEMLSLDARERFSPIWYVQGDRSIRRHLEALLQDVEHNLLVLVLNPATIEQYDVLIVEAAEQREVKILFPDGMAGGLRPIGKATCYEAGEMCAFFRENIFEKVFFSPIEREGVIFSLECILLADERESMLIYSQNGEQMAVIITLPFITCVQSKFFHQMMVQAHELCLSAAVPDNNEERTHKMKKMNT